jgi:hypothetical protein
MDTALEATGADVSSSVSWQAAEAPAGVPWPAVLIALAMIAAGARRPRRALALALVLILALFVFENGVHSVHHLNDRLGRAACAVASATAQVAGTLVDGAPVEPVILSSSERLVLDRRPSLEVRAPAAHRGRAPPLAA